MNLEQKLQTMREKRVCCKHDCIITKDRGDSFFCGKHRVGWRNFIEEFDLQGLSQQNAEIVLIAYCSPKIQKINTGEGSALFL